MRDFFKSFSYAFKGIGSAFRDERNLKVHVLATLLVVIAGFYFQIRQVEWLVIILCITLVVVTELVNTAIENLVDLVTTERKPLAGKIKDVAAGAVLIASIGALIAGVVIFYKYIVSQIIL